MSLITRETDRGLLRRTWASVFASTDPFTVPFTETIEAYVVFHPTDGYHLTRSQYEVLLAAARDVGDGHFFVSVVEYEPDFISEQDHWRCSFPSYDDYLRLPLVLENAIYSAQSQWGVLVSHEDHALVGGSREFMRHIHDSYPDWREDISRLRSTWVSQRNAEWVKEVVGRIELGGFP